MTLMKIYPKIIDKIFLIISFIILLFYILITLLILNNELGFIGIEIVIRNCGAHCHK
jgi:hypothetical protein